jgi:hypothetical protein
MTAAMVDLHVSHYGAAEMLGCARQTSGAELRDVKKA